LRDDSLGAAVFIEADGKPYIDFVLGGDAEEVQWVFYRTDESAANVMCAQELPASASE
jgi:hypothetical protein